jgi:hypothetical protein
MVWTSSASFARDVTEDVLDPSSKLLTDLVEQSAMSPQQVGLMLDHASREAKETLRYVQKNKLSLGAMRGMWNSSVALRQLWRRERISARCLPTYRCNKAVESTPDATDPRLVVHQHIGVRARCGHAKARVRIGRMRTSGPSASTSGLLCCDVGVHPSEKPILSWIDGLS